MGKTWDSDRGGRAQWTDWLAQVLRECLRCLKPGGYALVWAIPRRSHWTAIALEDAGFYIVDRIAHLFGSGFPKGKGQLKPACEDWWLCRKPGPRVLPLGVDECRVEVSEGVNGFRNGAYTNARTEQVYGGGKGLKDGKEYTKFQHPAGRWPANVVLSPDAEVLEAFAAFGQKASHDTQDDGSFYDYNRGGTIGAFSHGNSKQRQPAGRGDTGTAARYFFQAGHTQEELFFCRAKAIMEVWNPNLANTADDSFSLSSQHAVSALSDAVTLASHGAIRLSGLKGLSTNVTPGELMRLLQSVIALTLSFAGEPLSGSRHESTYPNGSRVRFVADQASGTTTITISHWKSDGSADAAMFEIMPLSVGVGDLDSANNLRLHYCAKASRAERDAGLEGMPTSARTVAYGAIKVRECKVCGSRRNDGNNGQPDCLHDDWQWVETTPNGSKGGAARNHHPTVKPLALMRWLVRLVTPPGGTCLDPFGGSGTTALACLAEGRRCVLVEREAEYLEIARRRIRAAQERGHMADLFDDVAD